jgi:hypothetical protein
MEKTEINSLIEEHPNKRFTIDFFKVTQRPVYMGYFVVLDDFESLKEKNLWRFLHSTRSSSFAKYMEDFNTNEDLAFNHQDLEKSKEYYNLSKEFYQKAKDLTVKIEGKQIEALQVSALVTKDIKY